MEGPLERWQCGVDNASCCGGGVAGFGETGWTVLDGFLEWFILIFDFPHWSTRKWRIVLAYVFSFIFFLACWSKSKDWQTFSQIFRQICAALSMMWGEQNGFGKPLEFMSCWSCLSRYVVRENFGLTYGCSQLRQVFVPNRCQASEQTLMSTISVGRPECCRLVCLGVWASKRLSVHERFTDGQSFAQKTNSTQWQMDDPDASRNYWDGLAGQTQECFGVVTSQMAVLSPQNKCLCFHKKSFSFQPQFWMMKPNPLRYPLRYPQEIPHDRYLGEQIR